MDEARLLLRVSSFFKGITFGVDFGSIGSRTIPEDGAADNLSIVGGDLLDGIAVGFSRSGANGSLSLS